MEEQSENVIESVVIDLIIFAVCSYYLLPLTAYATKPAKLLSSFWTIAGVKISLLIFSMINVLKLATFNLYAAKILKPTVRGFFCDDESIRYPAHESTVPSLLLYIVGVSVPVAFILLFEFLNKRQNRKEYSPYRIGKHKIPALYWNIYKMLLIYASGAVFNQTLTDIGKKVIGRLRPNFLDICKPPLETLCANPNTYTLIEGDHCTHIEGINPDISRVSFPSGHSSFAFYVAVFLVLYLQKRCKTKTAIAKPILQFTIIALAWFTALSRVMNNKHHWSDVLVGILLGSTVAIINTVFVHRLFDSNEYHQPISDAPNVLNPSNGPSNEAHAQL